MQLWGFFIYVLVRALSAVESCRLGFVVLSGFGLFLPFRAVLVLDQDMPNSESKTHFATCKLKVALTV